MEVSMQTPTRRTIHAILFFLGLVLIIGGTVSKTPGAMIIGLIIAAVNFSGWNTIPARESQDHQP
jgi:hypothetical protein